MNPAQSLSAQVAAVSFEKRTITICERELPLVKQRTIELELSAQNARAETYHFVVDPQLFKGQQPDGTEHEHFGISHHLKKVG
jgi:hypothetical protein